MAPNKVNFFITLDNNSTCNVYNYTPPVQIVFFHDFFVKVNLMEGNLGYHQT